MFAGRLLTGHSAGSNLVSSPIFVSEISHPDMRGTTSVMMMVCYTSGFFLSMLAGASLPWRTAAWVFGTTPLLSFSLLIFCRVNLDNKPDYVNPNLIHLGISLLAPQKWFGERGSEFLILLQRR